jgi:esterase/lipase superfamily enzyme
MTTFISTVPTNICRTCPTLGNTTTWGIVLGTGEWDNTRHETYRLSEILNSKGVKHWLDDGKWRGHDWNYWRDMLPYYLSVL